MSLAVGGCLETGQLCPRTPARLCNTQWTKARALTAAERLFWKLSWVGHGASGCGTEPVCSWGTGPGLFCSLQLWLDTDPEGLSEVLLSSLQSLVLSQSSQTFLCDSWGPGGRVHSTKGSLLLGGCSRGLWVGCEGEVERDIVSTLWSVPVVASPHGPWIVAVI